MGSLNKMREDRAINQSTLLCKYTHNGCQIIKVCVGDDVSLITRPPLNNPSILLLNNQIQL